MEADMAQDNEKSGLWAARFNKLRTQIRDGIKWWAEHQAWPATDDVRIDRHHRGCC